MNQLKKNYYYLRACGYLSFYKQKQTLMMYMHTDVCDEKIIYKAKRILGKNNSDETVSKNLGN